MPRRSPTQKISAKVSRKTAALALVTVLAMLIAPICAPLCAAKTCSSPRVGEQCHDMGAVLDSATGKIASSHKSCRVLEFSAVLLKLNEESSLSQYVRNDFSSLAISYSGLSAQAVLGAGSENQAVHKDSFGSPDSLSLITILRI
ncbi:MAG: hypothetical protein ABSH39_21505 [Candidatus Acidiferrum sp.]